MSGLTGYLTQYGNVDLSYIFHPKNNIPAANQDAIYSGTNTFSGTTKFSSELRLSCGTITGNITLSNPMLNFYQITSAATTIALPIPNSSHTGTFIIFKHTNTGNIAFTCSGISIVSIQSVGASTSATLTNAAVAMIACNGSAWWVYNVASL
jgi:hypothetical protein